MPDDVFETGVGHDFHCPFCRGRFFVPGETVTVQHSQPVCERFVALDPLEFIAAVNDALGARRD